MATDAEIMHQEMEPLAAGETADLDLVAELDFDPVGTAFTFTLATKPGREPVLTLTTAGGGLDLDVEGPTGGVYTATVAVHYLGADTEDLAAGDYHFVLWDTTNDARVAAGRQPVVPGEYVEPVEP